MADKIRGISAAQPISFPKKQGNEKSSNDKPCRVYGLGIEERIFQGSHFGPAGEAVSEDFNENDGAVMGGAKASFKGRLQAHFEFAQGDRFDPHGAPRNESRVLL